MTTHEIDELDEQFEIVVGRKAPLTLVPDWVTLYPASKSHPMYEGKILSPTAKAVYAVLAMHVNVSRGDSACWPSRKTIAQILGFSREQSVDQYLDQLDEADAIDREPITRANGAKGVRYIVHQTPPDGFEGEQSVGEHYKNRREQEAQKLRRSSGRPRKADAAEATPPVPEVEPQETAVDVAARTAADEWWAQAEELVVLGELEPLGTDRQKERARSNLVARIGDALGSGHDLELIKLTLRELGEWGPAKAKFERALQTYKNKTPEDVELDKQAQSGAKKWWAEAEARVASKKMGPLLADTKRQETGYYLNLRTRIREALKAGYDRWVIWDALVELGEWSPAKREFDRTLRRLSGVRQPRGARGGRAPLFSNDQWKQNETPTQGGAPEVPSAPDLSVFGVQSDDAA
ncbi:helix-turn-helix domain-containing protein [Streptomyces sp. NPDC002814]